MSLEIPETRPRVWSRELYLDIDELRRFRHAFRHIYDSTIEPDELMVAQSRVPRVSDRGCSLCSQRFSRKTEGLADQLEE